MKSLRKKQLQTIEHEEVYEKINQNASHMDEMQKCIEKQLQTFISVNQNTTVISESMKKYSVESANFNSKIPLADCLQRSSEWQTSIGDVFKHLGNLLYDRTTQPLKETIRIQTEIVKDGKKRLKNFGGSSTTGNTSGSSNVVMSNNMGTQKVEKKDQIEYDKLSKDTLQLFRDSELALENSAIQSILSSFESYYDFFQKGAFQMNKIKSEIENYKKIILETNKAAAKLRNYIPRKTFSIRLEEVFARESNKALPSFLEELFKYLERVAPQTEGIFRISAGKSSVEKLQKKIEDNQPLELNLLVDSHVVSSVLKLFFRMLPEPLIHHSIYKAYLHLGTSKPSQTTIITELKRLISSLKVCNQVVLKHILQICSLVNANKDITKMDLNNLSVVIGPNLLEPLPGLKAEDLQKPDTFTEFYALFGLLVENCQSIFPQVSQTEFGRSRSQTEPAISPIAKSSPSSSNLQSPLLQSPISSTNKTNLSTSDFVILNEQNSSKSSTPSADSNNNSNSNSPKLSSTSALNLSQPPQSPIQRGVASSPTSSTPTKKKINDDNLLKPIDIQINFIHITSSLSRVKSHLDQILTVPEGIQLIKLFKKLGDDYITPIQKLIHYQNTKPKPNYDNDPTEDKIIKIQRTLSYTYDVMIDSLINANNLFESTLSDQDSDSLTSIFNDLNDFIQNEIKTLLNEEEKNEIQTSTSSLSSF